MITFDLPFFLRAIPVVMLAAISKAGFGSGAAYVAAAILALVLRPGGGAGGHVALLVLVDVTSPKPCMGKWHWPSAVWIIAVALPGVLVGAWLYTLVDADDFRLLIWLICPLFVAYQGARAVGWIGHGTLPLRRDTAALARVAAGFTSFFEHAGGPPVAIFLLGQGLSKTAYQATTVIVFWIINLLKFLP